MSKLSIHGNVQPGFERVRAAFISNFEQRAEIGAACAVYYRGENVVDLWGGLRDKAKQSPWTYNTPALVFSASKGVAALVVAHWVSQGYAAYEDPIAKYWPAFASHGKGHITIESLINHQAGLHCLHKPLTLASFHSWEKFETMLANQVPRATQGYAYHAQSVGWYLDALCHRIDPKGRRLSQYLQEEFMQPLDQSFFIGLPQDYPLEELATMYDYGLWKLVSKMQRGTRKFIGSLLNPWSETNRTLRNPKLKHLKDLGVPPWCYIPMPGSNGIGTARSLARLYHLLVDDSGPVQLSPTIRQRLCHNRPGIAIDHVIGGRASYHLGWKQSGLLMGSSELTFGFPGFGGAYAYVDLGRGLSYAYTPNRLGYLLWNDPRDLALRYALMSAEGIKA